jgi:hypothetical protein
MAKHLKTLTRRNIMTEVEKIADTGKRGAADDLRKHVYTFLQWAQNEGHIEHNVLLGYRKPKATRADRFGRRTKGRALTDDEIMGGQAQFSEALSMQSAEDEFGASSASRVWLLVPTQARSMTLRNCLTLPGQL